MAKLKDGVITEVDLLDYLESQSDFEFELQVLTRLMGMGLRCDHSGTYEDPATKKLRQFDIRASMKLGYARVYLAVECKQLRANFPLLIQRVPRRRDESFHDLLLVVDLDKVPKEQLMGFSGLDPRNGTISVRDQDSLYLEGEMVGKSCAQVGRDKGGGITGTDDEMFGKWTQAISSAQGLLADACHNTPIDRDGWDLALVLPIVVVPDKRLWVADHTSDGKRSLEPVQVERCPFFLSADCYVDRMSGTNYRLSHLEFVTLSGLERFIENLGNRTDGPHARYFPLGEAKERFARWPK